MNKTMQKSSKPMQKLKLNHKQMLYDILELVDGDFSQDMEVKSFSPTKAKYSQEEALTMARIIGEVYGIAHCLYCGSCGRSHNYGMEEK